jgi:hypothetical protein
MQGFVERVEILERRLGNVLFQVVRHPWFSNRKGIYGETSFTPYGDNFARFSCNRRRSSRCARRPAGFRMSSTAMTGRQASYRISSNGTPIPHSR